MPRGPFVEDRHTLANSDGDREAFAAVIVERGGGVLQRRKMLGGLLGGGLGIFGVVALFPLLRSLGPLPKKTLDTTDWKKGSYVVDQSGRRVMEGDLAIGTISTVFPEGTQNTDRGQSVDQTVLIRVSNEGFTTMKGVNRGHRRATWPIPRCAHTSGAPSACTNSSCSCSSALVTSRCST